MANVTMTILVRDVENKIRVQHKTDVPLKHIKTEAAKIAGRIAEQFKEDKAAEAAVGV